MNIKQIIPPTFYILHIEQDDVPVLISEGGISLNEYELRQLQIDIKNSQNVVAYFLDSQNNQFMIQPNGKIKSVDGEHKKLPHGLDLSYTLVKQLFS